MEKIQTRGHCQVCGRIQAFGASGMAKHGYAVVGRGDGGYFHGTCQGSHHANLERDRSVLDGVIQQVRNDLVGLKKDLNEVIAGRKHPKTVWFDGFRISVAKDRPRSARYKLTDYKELSAYHQDDVRRQIQYQIESRIRMGESFVKDMLKLAEKVHGADHITINKTPDTSKVISVGSKVKVAGREVTVTKIEYAMARGIGPGINGQTVEHVFWTENGVERKYPKRYARKVM